MNLFNINYTGDEISQILRTSYEIFPRKYVFEKFDKKPYADIVFKALLGDILQNKNSGMNAVRSSFSTSISKIDENYNGQSDNRK